MCTARLAFPDGARAEIIVGLNYGVIASGRLSEANHILTLVP